jgi:restriction endonuclease
MRMAVWAEEDRMQAGQEDRDQYGTATGKTLYLMAETKSTKRLDDLRPDERRKIICGEHHFRGALKTEYLVVTSAAELG